MELITSMHEVFLQKRSTCEEIDPPVCRVELLGVMLHSEHTVTELGLLSLEV